MNKNKDYEQPIDPVLFDKITSLSPTPERDPQLVSQGRERFLAEMEGLPAASSTGWLAGLKKPGNLGSSSVRIFNRKFAISTIVGLIVVVVMLFGGASATAYASQSALPGDALYPIKTSLELTQISLANGAYIRAQLHLEFAQRRMDEINELLLQGRYSDVVFASSEFEYYIKQAMEATQTVQAADPDRGAGLSRLVSQALLDYAIALKTVLLDAPEVVKPAIENALLVSQDGVGDEIEIIGIVASISDLELEIDGEIYLINELTEIKDVIEVGDMVKIHAILTADGSRIAREVELDSDFGEDNGNGHDGSFDDNDNEDRNINDNDSDHDESDNNINDNESDDNENENESEDNENENESEDNQNSNESNDNESEDNENHNESEDNENDDESDDNENDNHSNENENDNESEDNENKNESDEDGNDNDD